MKTLHLLAKCGITSARNKTPTTLIDIVKTIGYSLVSYAVTNACLW